MHTSHRDMRAKHIARCTVIWMGGGGRHIHTTMIVASQEGGSEAATKRSGASACVSLPDCASTTSSNIRGILVRVVDAAVVTCTVRSRRGSHAVMFCWMREEDMQLRLRRWELVLLCFMFAFERTEGMVSVIGGPRKGPSGACG